MVNFQQLIPQLSLQDSSPNQTNLPAVAGNYSALPGNHPISPQSQSVFNQPVTDQLSSILAPLPASARVNTFQDALPSQPQALFESGITSSDLPSSMSTNQASQLATQLGAHSGLDVNSLPNSLTPEQAVALVNHMQLGSAPGGPVTGHGTWQGPAAPTPKDKQAIVSQVDDVAGKLFGQNELPALHELIMKESGFNPNAKNPTSTASGLFQFLDSTKKNYGISKNASVPDQITAGLKYIAQRYGSPSQALVFHNQRGYY